MSTIQIMSDLHLEFHRDRGRSFANSLSPLGKLENVDVLVLAGDIITVKKKQDAINFLDRICGEYPEVLWVPGNHEFYELSVQKTNKILNELEAKYPNLTVTTEPRVVKYPSLGIGIVAGTMWFPDLPDNFMYERHMNDFFEIQGFKPWVFEQNKTFMDLLDKNLQPGDVVVTHHLPSNACVSPKYKTSVLNRFFVSQNAERFILDRQPKLWVSGHTHHSYDFMIDQTRMICNAYGYPGETGVTFNDRLLIKL